MICRFVWSAATAPTKFRARAINLLIARGGCRDSARINPEDLIELRQGARIIERSK
jgi:hypothetical protein